MSGGLFKKVNELKQKLEERKINQLKQKIKERLSWKLYPFLSGMGYRAHPLLIAECLKRLEPAHLIEIIDKGILVDGKFFENTLSIPAKTSAALIAITELYGPFTPDPLESLCLLDSEIKLHPPSIQTKPFASVICSILEQARLEGKKWNIVVRISSAIKKTLRGYSPILLEFGEKPPEEAEKWIILLCAPLSFTRFAILLKPMQKSRITLTPENCYLPDPIKEGLLSATLAIGPNNHLFIAISSKFFNNPSIENVEFFGDLCLLAQARKNWQITHPLKANTYPVDEPGWLETLDMMAIVDLLRRTPGYKNFVDTALSQLFIKNKEDQDLWVWQLFLKIAQENQEETKKPQ